MEFVVHERGSAVQRFPLDEGETFVGRGEENRVVLSAAKISGEHLVLRRSGDTLMLEDLESTNGTFVNGRRSAGRIEVFRGDRIYLGDYVAWVEGGLASRDISDEAHTVSEDALLMASRPPPGLKGAPRAFLEEGEAYRLRRRYVKTSPRPPVRRARLLWTTPGVAPMRPNSCIWPPILRRMRSMRIGRRSRCARERVPSCSTRTGGGLAGASLEEG
ncbi:MAG: FHA domain-containing protein [Nannocystaceae bacterium]